MSRRYDSRTTIFSPDGRLFQVRRGASPSPPPSLVGMVWPVSPRRTVLRPPRPALAALLSTSSRPSIGIRGPVRRTGLSRPLPSVSPRRECEVRIAQIPGEDSPADRDSARNLPQRFRRPHPSLPSCPEVPQGGPFSRGPQQLGAKQLGGRGGPGAARPGALARPSGPRRSEPERF